MAETRSKRQRLLDKVNGCEAETIILLQPYTDGSRSVTTIHPDGRGSESHFYGADGKEENAPVWD